MVPPVDTSPVEVTVVVLVDAGGTPVLRSLSTVVVLMDAVAALVSANVKAIVGSEVVPSKFSL